MPCRYSSHCPADVGLGTQLHQHHRRFADGYRSDAYGGQDCNDIDAAYNPGVAEFGTTATVTAPPTSIRTPTATTVTTTVVTIVTTPTPTSTPTNTTTVTTASTKTVTVRTRIGARIPAAYSMIGNHGRTRTKIPEVGRADVPQTAFAAGLLRCWVRG